MSRPRYAAAIVMAVLVIAGPVAAGGLAVDAPDRTAEPGATVSIPVTIANDGQDGFIVGLEIFPADELQIEEVDGDGTYYPNKSAVLYLSKLEPGETFETVVKIRVPDRTNSTYDLGVSVLPAEGARINETATIKIPAEVTPTPTPAAETVSILGFEFEIDLPDFSEWFA